MRTPIHPWRTIVARHSTRFSFGLLVSLSLVLVAFEWRSTPPGLVLSGDPLPPEPPVELPPVVIIERAKPAPTAAPRKRATAVRPVVDPTPPTPEPGPDPGPDPGPGVSGDLVPVAFPVDTAVVVEVMPWDGVGVRPFFKECLSLTNNDRDACTEARIDHHLQRRFRMPDGLRGSVSTVVTFEIDKHGHIGRLVCTPRVERAVEREVERVIRSLPEFVPGSQGGHPVAVYYRLPVRFTQY